MATITGIAGDDTLTGTYASDYFDLTLGGDDDAKGKSGIDLFSMGATLTAADRIDGGVGNDTVQLQGDYSAGLVFAAATMVDVEGLYLVGGFDYDLTLRDANNQTTFSFTVNAQALGATDTLTFDGSAETNSGYSIYAGAGADRMTGGRGADTFYIFQGGADRVSGLDGNDNVYALGALTANDKIDGGAGFDVVSLQADYKLKLGANSLTSVEQITCFGAFSVKLTLVDANIAANESLIVYAGFLPATEKLVLNASLETDGSVVATGGAGRDALTGGGGDDTLDGSDGQDVLAGGDGDDLLYGRGSHDQLTGGGGQDTYWFDEGHSPLGNPDLITDLANSDIVDVSSIDANTALGGDQAFTVVGAFTGAAGQLTLDYDSGSNTTDILMDTDGDSIADEIVRADGNRTGFTQFVL